MSNTQNNQTRSTAAQSKSPIVPDGKSKLPDMIPDFPATDPNDGAAATDTKSK